MAKSQRLKLHQDLIDVTGWKVYFQPPENLKIEYPCVVYELESWKNIQANNRSYLCKDRYNVKLIHRDPDTEVPDAMRRYFFYLNRGTRYIADNLYHDVFTLYY